MDNVMWAMALLELGILALVVGVVVWAIRKKSTETSDQHHTNDSK